MIRLAKSKIAKSRIINKHQKTYTEILMMKGKKRVADLTLLDAIHKSLP